MSYFLKLVQILFICIWVKKKNQKKTLLIKAYQIVPICSQALSTAFSEEDKTNIKIHFSNFEKLIKAWSVSNFTLVFRCLYFIILTCLTTGCLSWAGLLKHWRHYSTLNRDSSFWNLKTGWFFGKVSEGKSVERCH